ncbi:unnamed protein product, partial [Porites evermanni]
MIAATAAMIATKMQLVQIPLEALIAAVSQDSQEMAANVMISMNAATVAMIATKMQLVQIPLEALIAAVSQDLQEMAANVMNNNFFVNKSCTKLTSLYHFEKYQDLPTRGAHAVEHFTINGSLFLAFANHESDTTEKYNTDSFIYKFNDLTEKFFLYQTIGTHGGHDVEYFTISGEHYLAVANVQNENTFRLNSVIYLWNGTLFVAFQNLTTKGGASFNFFTIAKEPFLTACNLFDDVTKSINSTIYKWKNNMFEKFQEIATEAGRGSAAFVINNESYIAFANAVPSATSVVYKRAGMHFVELQKLQKHSAMNVKSFYINDDVFLATASQPTQSFVHKWNGSQFFLFKTIPTYRARVLYPFVMCGQTFLGAANRRRGGTYHIKSVVYRFSQDQFTEYQKISTFGAVDMTSFEHKGYTYLAIANSGNEN